MGAPAPDIRPDAGPTPRTPTQMERWVERWGYPLFLVVNAGCLIALYASNFLDEASVVVVHFLNIFALATLEFVAPMNPKWLIVQPEGNRWQMRWHLFLKTYLWYFIDSRVWFRLHGIVVLSAGVWIAKRYSFDASTLPPIVQLVGFALLIDFIRYWIHRGQHSLTVLWRWHTMHHVPTNMTPVRAWWTHPVDDVILYSFDIVLMVVLGIDPAVVLIYVSLDNGFQLLNHANVRLEHSWLSVVFQHPRYHLLHHRRLDGGEHTVNFGEMFTFWDRLFGTFAVRPSHEMQELEIGIAPVKTRTLWHQVSAPFYRKIDDL